MKDKGLYIHLHTRRTELYSSVNVVDMTYFSGIMKCSRDHSSFREFCRGVPVIKSLWLDLNSIMVLYRSESSFFSRCASSTPMKAQLTLPRNDWTQIDFFFSFTCNTCNNITLHQFRTINCHHTQSDKASIISWIGCWPCLWEESHM